MRKTFCLSHSDFLLPVKPASNSSRLAIGSRGDIRHTSLPCGATQCLRKLLPNPLWSNVASYLPRKAFVAVLCPSFNVKMPPTSDKAAATEASVLLFCLIPWLLKSVCSSWFLPFPQMKAFISKMLSTFHSCSQIFSNFCYF